MTKSKKIILETISELDISKLAAALKSTLGSDKVHVGENSDLGNPRQFIPSGVPDLDLVLDREGRGWPVGRIVEIFGAEATAKTAIGYSLIAQAQKLGGKAILYPAEGNWDEWLAGQYGVDQKNLILGDDETVEGVFDSWRNALKIAGSDGLLVGMIDSIASLSTRAELEEEKLVRGRAAQIRAMMISAALRRMGAVMPRTSSILFCVNQIRDATDVLYGEKTKPPGGRALKFYASIRLKLESIGKITREKEKKKYVAGFKLHITAVKNRLAKPYQQATILLDYEKGLLPLKKKSK